MWQFVTDKNHWNKLVSVQPHARFLHSWQWGDFQQALGRKVLRFSWADKILAQAIKMNLPGGFAYWYIPHGPVVISGAELSEEAWSELVKILGGHGAIFLRVDPTFIIPSFPRRGKGVVLRQISSTQPQCTLVMDLNRPSEQLLASMHQKTRYNINLAEKKGVVIKAGTINDFLRLNKQTTSRDRFVSHDDNYYRQMIKPLSNEVKIWQAEVNNKVLASALVMYFGDTATYTHGASSNVGRNLMAPYLLHWKIIQDAKQQGFKFYDLGGVNPADEKDEAFKKSWQGITRFKQGFGGEIVCHPPSFDLIYRPNWYSLYRLSSAVYRIFL